MRYMDLDGMEHESRPTAGSISSVANDRAADDTSMQTKLVRASGLGEEA